MLRSLRSLAMTASFSKSKIFLLLCLSIIGGIFFGWLAGSKEEVLGSDFKIITITALAVAAFIVLGVFWERRAAKIIGLSVLFFVFGFLRWEAGQIEITEEHIAFYNDQEEITFRGVVVREPDVRDKNTKLTVSCRGEPRLRQGFGGQAWLARTGKVLVTVPRYPEYNYGDELEITCQLKIPKEYPDFSYKDYLSRFNIYSVCYPKEAEIKLVSSGNGSFVYSSILKLKGRAKRVVEQILPEPQSSLLAAITLGAKRGIPEEIRDDFSKAGLSHIVAISGLHITLLSSLVMSALLSLGLWRKHAFYLAVLFLVFYIIFIGAPASAIRAGIMGFLILLALNLGRLSHSVNSIVLAGTLILLFNPKLLPYDVGFQLSFAAVLGIVFIYPILGNALETIIRRGAPWRTPTKMAIAFNSSGFIKTLIFLTISAQVTILPLVIYHFGTLSLIAPLSNILVVPLLPLIMILGFLSIIAGFIYWLFGFLAAFLVYVPLTYIIKLSHFLTQIPGSFVEFKMRAWMVAVYYFALAGFLFWHNKKIAPAKSSFVSSGRAK